MKKLLLLFLLVSSFALGQAARYDSFTWSVSNYTPGLSSPLISIPGATITVYLAGSNTKATTYTSSTLLTPCGSTTQVVLADTATCVATSDSYGNFGFWAVPGNYEYTVTYNGTTTDRYPVYMGITDGSDVTFRTVDSIRFATGSYCTNAPLHDQTCINNAIADAPTGGLVIVPYQSDWVLTGAININKSVTVDCLGWSTTLRVSSALSAATDIVYVAGASTGIEGGGIQNCQFLPQSGTPGRDGMRLDTTTYSISKFIVSHNYFGTFGGKGINLINPSLTDGYFTSWIRNNVIYNGITLQRAGDTDVIAENVIPAGANIGIDATQVVGAMNLTIEKNNITYTGACMHLGDAVRFPRILNNECEGNVSTTGSNSAAMDIAGTVTNPVWQPVITGNNIAGVAVGIDGLRLDYVQSAYVEGNIIFRAGSAKNIRVTANAAAGTNTIGCGNYYIPNTDTQSSILADAGSSNVCWQNPFSQSSQGGYAGGFQFTRSLTAAGVVLPNLFAVVGRNAANSASVNLLYLDGTDKAALMGNTVHIDPTGKVTADGGLDANSIGIGHAGPISGATTVSANNQITSTLAIGTPPLAVTSTTVNTNFNADMIDGVHVSTNTVGHALCQKDSTHISYCESVVASDGTCTCH
jgi:hypothetical protein